jgi:hypothetical protein
LASEELSRKRKSAATVDTDNAEQVSIPTLSNECNASALQGKHVYIFTSPHVLGLMSFSFPIVTTESFPPNGTKQL